MKPFNLEEYIKNPSKKIITRDGRNARIICTDVRGDYPVAAAVKHYDDAFDNVYTYTKDGIYHPNEKTVDDLFFAPEKHERWANLYKSGLKGYTLGGNTYISKELAERTAVRDYVATVKIEWEE